MGDKAPIGVAYRDQDLSGSTITSSTISASRIVGSTITGSTVSGGAFTSPVLSGTITVAPNATVDAVGFFGVTPVVQPTTSLQAAVLTTAAISSAATNGGWLFSTSTQANGIVTLVNRLRADLVSLGIIKGS